MGKTAEDIERIRKNVKDRAHETMSKLRIKYSKEEVLEKWETIKNENDSKLTYAYARNNYDWWISACGQFGGYSTDWYGFLRAMGKTDEKIIRIRAVGRTNLGKRLTTPLQSSRSAKTIIIIDEMNGATAQPSPREYSKALSEMNSSDFIATKQYDPKVIRIVLSTNGNGNKEAKEQTPAEKIRGLIGLGADWNDPEFARKYKEALPHMAPWVVHRASILYLLGMAAKKQIEMPKTVLSAASGPSEVFEAIDDLKQAFGTNGIPIPDVCDLDLSKAMLAVGNNKNQKIGDIRNTGFDNQSFDMVENSSIFQFSPEDVKTTLVEKNRILKDGGLVFLVSNGKKFSDSFYEGLKECGFEIISGKNEMLLLSGSGRKALEDAHGDKFAKNFDSALGDSVFILARKISEPNTNIEEKQFRFEDFGSAPKEIREFVADFREFLKGIEQDESEKCSIARENAIRRFADIRENHHDILVEYRKVINRMQEKFWTVASKQPDKRLKRLRVSGGESGVLAATWRTFGRKF
jgi:ubiquinone/menaquinone biosynthesis C-methylase UbiE